MKTHYARLDAVNHAGCGVYTMTKTEPPLTRDRDRVTCGRCIAMLNAPYFQHLAAEGRV